MRIITIFSYVTVEEHPQLSPNHPSKLHFIFKAHLRNNLEKVAISKMINQKTYLHKPLRLTTKILHIKVESEGKCYLAQQWLN